MLASIIRAGRLCNKATVLGSIQTKVAPICLLPISQSSRIQKKNTKISAMGVVSFCTRHFASTATPKPILTKIQDDAFQVSDEIMTDIKKSFEATKKVLEDSQDKAYQKENICSFIEKPLPVSNSTTWDPLYFEDYSLTQMKSLCVAINNAREGQQKKLVSIVQACGTGKTHLGMAYARMKGGIFIDFKGAHHKLLEIAREAIEQITIGVDEDRANALSIRILTLIPWTFVQFASKFYRAGDLCYLDMLWNYFLHASLNSGAPIIENMFAINAKQALDDEWYTKFYFKAMPEAKTLGLGAWFYDEVQLMEFSIDSSIRVGKTSKKKERPTLLQFLIRIMENSIVANNIAQIGMSPSLQALASGYKFKPADPRGKLDVETIVLHEEPQDRCERFVGVLSLTFGEKVIEPFVKKHQATITKLASRPIYLFEFFKQISLIGKEYEKFEDLFDTAIEKTVKKAEEQAEVYTNNMLSNPEALSAGSLQAILRLWMGKDHAVLSPPDVNQLHELGLPTGPSNKKKPKTKKTKRNVKK